MDYNEIIKTLKNNNYTHEQYDIFINICKNKQEEIEDNNYLSKIKMLNNDFIKLLSNFHFYTKTTDTLISFNIKFNYSNFIITLSNKKSFCSEFGCISIENDIHIIDNYNENCYNLFGDNLIHKFIKIINLNEINISVEELKDIFNNMFNIYQPNENIHY